jgi:hypothetical protein
MYPPVKGLGPELIDGRVDTVGGRASIPVGAERAHGVDQTGSTPKKGLRFVKIRVLSGVTRPEDDTYSL